jgi:hypothetical protein
MSMRCAFALPLVAFAMLGCKGMEEKPPPFEMLVHVESDPGRPLEGASVQVNGKQKGRTAQDGRARLSFVGKEGEAFDLWVRCPNGYMSPTKPITASLRRISDPSKLPQYDALCPPLERTVVVAIRADNGPNLPVMYLDKEIARTDVSGAAHVLLPMKPGDSFQLTLATNEKGNEKLRPQNPSLPFTARSQDDVFLFEQRFTREREPVRYVKGPEKPKHLP